MATKIYKGKAISKLFPSGYYEIYSDCAGRFLKFDRVGDAKARINREAKGCGGLSGTRRRRRRR